MIKLDVHIPSLADIEYSGENILAEGANTPSRTGYYHVGMAVGDAYFLVSMPPSRTRSHFSGGISRSDGSLRTMNPAAKRAAPQGQRPFNAITRLSVIWGNGSRRGATLPS
jgi:hypothetical protein